MERTIPNVMEIWIKSLGKFQRRRSIILQQTQQDTQPIFVRNKKDELEASKLMLESINFELDAGNVE